MSIIQEYRVSERVFRDMIRYRARKRRTEDVASEVRLAKSDKNKRTVLYYNDTEILTTADWLVYIADRTVSGENWKRIHCVLAKEQKEDFIQAMTPPEACRLVNKIIYKHYEKEEAEDIFHAHEAEEAHIAKKYPYVPAYSTPVVVRHKDCYEYDINGAYAAILIEMFPKCEAEFTDLFNRRHDNHNRYKNVYCYYVGCLTQNEEKAKIKPRFTRTKTYNYITSRVYEQVLERIKACSGKLLYVNTDGFIVKEPKNIFEHSDKLGEFKLEYSGDVYVFQERFMSGYTVWQCGDDVKGTLELTRRDGIDLRRGLVKYFNESKEIIKQLEIKDA